jgi:negative regulator of sigma E activity
MTNASETTPKGRPVPDEVLMAYVDGELPEDERKAVRAALAADQSLVERMQSFLFTRGPLLRPFDAVLASPIPERLSALLANAAPAPQRRAPGTSGSSKLRQIIAGFWTPFLSPAAAIPVVIAGVAGGWLLQQALNSDFVALDSRGGLVASAAVQAALETTPMKGQAAIGSQVTLEPTFTFATAKDGWCRQYRLTHRDGQSANGLACRDHGLWRVIVQTPGALRPHSSDKTVPAGEDEGVVGEVRSAMKEGDVLGREEEERLMREHWPARPQTQ